jgi:hypothetical protein
MHEVFRPQPVGFWLDGRSACVSAPVGCEPEGGERLVGGVLWLGMGIRVVFVWGVGLYLAQGAQLGEAGQFFRAASGGAAFSSSVT